MVTSKTGKTKRGRIIKGFASHDKELELYSTSNMIRFPFWKDRHCFYMKKLGNPIGGILIQEKDNYGLTWNRSSTDGKKCLDFRYTKK